MIKRAFLIVIAAAGMTCGDTTPEATLEAAQAHPDVIEAVAMPDGEGTFTFEVTLSSRYDSNERYADAWRIKGEDGRVFGVRELTHPHANEQPFTRSLRGVEIPDGVSVVIVEGRDLINGWGGDTFELMLP